MEPRVLENLLKFTEDYDGIFESKEYMNLNKMRVCIEIDIKESAGYFEEDLNFAPYPTIEKENSIQSVVFNRPFYSFLCFKNIPLLILKRE